MSGGGKGGGGSAIVGYRYFMGIQIVVSHGPVDTLRRIFFGEREGWAGSVTANSTININKPDLFGGDAREGGVIGNVDVMMGVPAQGRNAYLAAHQGANCPGYRGLFSLVFNSFMWSSGNPYFKPVWVEVTRILQGWGGTAWNAADATINTLDMNPAHIIYQCLTNATWGMGYSSTEIGNASFTAAATKLKNEGFGLSLVWQQESSIEAFVQTILSHINGALGMNMSTGQLELKLIRDDYDINTLLQLDESNVLDLKTFQRAAIGGDSLNEVVVIYRDRDGRDTPVAVQNLASISAQGAIVSTTKNYPGIREPQLAARVASRDLATLASPLAKVTLTTNRVMWDKEKGDVVRLVWPTLGINGVAFRIIDINKGNLTDSKIEVTLIEDIFGLPTSSYSASMATQWTDNVVPPIAADATFAVEAPYWEVVKNVSLANQSQLLQGYGFGMVMASRGAVQSPLGYTLSASSNNIDYRDVAAGSFSPTGLLSSNITPDQTNIALSGAYDLDQVRLSADGGYGYIGDECVSVLACDPSTGALTIGRGILDTTPKPHLSNTRMFFKSVVAAYDPTERTSGEVVYYKPRPSTGMGTLALPDAPAVQLTLANRASRPYPPGNFKIAGLSYPASIPGPSLSITWSHRDRAAQTVSFADHTTGNIGPEPDTSYRVRLYSGATLLRTYDIAGSATSWTYPTDDDNADLNVATLKVELTSVRKGLEALYPNVHTVTRLTSSGGVFLEGPPATPTLTATAGGFSINLTWLFGDARTNLVYTEIRVSRTPIFTDSEPLQYVNYPTAEYVHELTEVGGIRWYWIRVGDNSGFLSAWSASATARAGYKAGVPSVDALPTAPTTGNEVVRLTSNNKLYIWTGTAWITGVEAGDIVGEINGSQIVVGSIGSTEIAANAIVTGHIAANAVVAASIAAGTIAANHIAAEAVTADKIAADSITAAQIATGAITADELAANAVIAGKIAANAVTANTIAAGQIQAGHMTANSITAANAAIADLAVTNAKIANLSVDTGKIADLSVNTLKIAGNAVTLPVSVYSAAQTTSVPLSATIDSSNYSVTVMASTVIMAGELAGTAGLARVRLTLNGVEQAKMEISANAYDYVPASFNMKFTGLSGTNTFRVEGYVVGGRPADTLFNTGIIVLVVKK